MLYTAPRILTVLNAKNAIQTAKPTSPNDDGMPFQTSGQAYQADE
jgi:hypothetical protein